MPCMKRPFATEREALNSQHRINARTGDGPTRQVAYPCPDCSDDMGPETWHLRTERPIEGKLARVIKLKTPPQTQTVTTPLGRRRHRREMGRMSKTFYFLKDQDWLKFLKPAERAEIDAATQAFHDAEGGYTCQHLQPRQEREQCPGTCPGDVDWCCLEVIA